MIMNSGSCLLDEIYNSMLDLILGETIKMLNSTLPPFLTKSTFSCPFICEFKKKKKKPSDYFYVRSVPMSSHKTCLIVQIHHF